eukprot:scaffold92534_cov69-Phaeocystis_antarctica.AAC.3
MSALAPHSIRPHSIKLDGAAARRARSRARARPAPRQLSARVPSLAPACGGGRRSATRGHPPAPRRPRRRSAS